MRIIDTINIMGIRRVYDNKSSNKSFDDSSTINGYKNKNIELQRENAKLVENTEQMEKQLAALTCIIKKQNNDIGSLKLKNLDSKNGNSKIKSWTNRCRGS